MKKLKDKAWSGTWKSNHCKDEKKAEEDNKARWEEKKKEAN